MENNTDKLKAKKAQLISRKCPHCREQIKHYTFNSITIPHEYLAHEAVDLSADAEIPYSLYFWGRIGMSTFSRIILSSTCKCGNISFWDCKKEDIEALISEDMRNKGIFIEQVYAKEYIAHMVEMAKPGRFKTDLQELLSLFPKTDKE